MEELHLVPLPKEAIEDVIDFVRVWVGEGEHCSYMEREVFAERERER